MTTMQLDCFLIVAETLNFAAAADRLHVTQPAVTQQIHSLEKELNVKLFKRTTRTVKLTPEGFVFLNDAKSIQPIIGHAKKRFEEPASRELVLFSIGCHRQNELNLLPDILKKMRVHYPALHPVFQVIPFHHLHQLLKEDSVDVILDFQKELQRKSYGTYKELMKVKTMCILPEDSPLSQKAGLTIDDLKKEKVILFNPQIAPDCFNLIQRVILDQKSMADIYMQDSPESCITLAKAGFGIAVLPDLIPQKDTGLASIPFTGFEPMSYGAYYNSTAGNPVLKLFLQLCREQFTTTPSESKAKIPSPQPQAPPAQLLSPGSASSVPPC